jgi:hypothetical protein
MDVYGRNPTSEKGKYFRNNVWRWRPLANYIAQIAPVNITGQCEHWHSNDGDGLGADESAKLAMFLRNELSTGRTAAYASSYQAEIDALADEKCDLCNGTGVRSDAIGISDGMTTRIITEDGHPRIGQKGWCNKCDGRGTVRPWETCYPFSAENVVEFCDFLEQCGGFEIC